MFTGCTSNDETVDQVMTEEWKAMSSDQSLPPFPTDLQNSGIESDLNIFDEIRAELIQEEQQILAEYESSLLIEEHASEASLEERLLCPVCQVNPLLKNKGVIFCYCGVRIDTETDCVTLAMVKENLNNGLQEHNKTCGGQPKFSYNDISGIGMFNILMTCDVCQVMHIVV